jgi:hypothetical protein
MKFGLSSHHRVWSVSLPYLASSRAAAALRFAESARDGLFLAALSLILAINVIDLLPNSPLTPWTWLICGSLLGRSEALRAAVRAWQNRLPYRRQDHCLALSQHQPVIDPLEAHNDLISTILIWNGNRLVTAPGWTVTLTGGRG